MDAVRTLEPFCGEFLYTHVDAEGLMKGTDIQAILSVRRATTRRVTAAGGITTQEEIRTVWTPMASIRSSEWQSIRGSFLFLLERRQVRDQRVDVVLLERELFHLQASAWRPSLRSWSSRL